MKATSLLLITLTVALVAATVPHDRQAQQTQSTPGPQGTHTENGLADHYYIYTGIDAFEY